MRLTLRTLLAWLDDTLPPSEVREIGNQVSESPFAKDLVEKIHRVTRQRRLTVPPDKGPDATDPALVARYLDNELDPDEVAELEKKCLISDVHLAEVASVHQILSLIGQKAKVPAEARHRMYQLVRGREAVKRGASRASRQTEPTAPREQAQPWISSAPHSRPFWEQYGPAAAVVALMAVLGFTAWKTLSTPEAPQFARAPVAPPVVPSPPSDEKKREVAKPAPVERAVEKPAETAAVRDTKEATGSPPKDEADKKNATPEMTDDVPQPSPPAGPVREPALPGSVGLVKKADGVVLRFNADHREWERVTGVTTLGEQDRLLNLEPFRTPVELGTAEVDLVSGTEVWARSTPTTQAARLVLANGRAVLHGTAPTLPFEIQFGGKSIKVTPPPGGKVGVERINRRPAGSKASAPVLRVHAADGPVTVETGSNSTTLGGAGAVTVEADGSFSEESARAAPRWVTDPEPVPYDQERGEQFLKFLPPERPILASLVEASEDDQKEVCRLAISALYGLGDVSMIVPLLNDKNGASASVRRKATIAALRQYLCQGPEALKELRSQLQRVVGVDLAATAEELLVGYTPKEAADEATYAKLVKLLAYPDPGEVGVRELALENLMELTGRDDLDYNPEKAPKPEDKGLKAWRDLLHTHDLKPPTSVIKPPAATPKAASPTPKAAGTATKGAASTPKSAGASRSSTPTTKASAPTPKDEEGP